MKVFTLAKLIITFPLCLDVDSLPDAICSVCECQSSFGVFCGGEEISGLMSDETLQLGADFPVIDLRNSEGLRKGMVHCETVFGSTKILLSGSGVRCGELLAYSSLSQCDHKVCNVSILRSLPHDCHISSACVDNRFLSFPLPYCHFVCVHSEVF